MVIINYEMMLVKSIMNIKYLMLSYNEVHPHLEEFCRVYSEIINQRPVGDLKEKIVITPESRRIEERNMHKRGILWHTGISLEQDGHISALTDIMHNPREPYWVHQYFTGVLRQCRRRGLAKRFNAEILKLWERP